MGKKRKGHKSHHSRKNPQGFGIELSDFGSKLKSAINAKKHEQEETQIKDKNELFIFQGNTGINSLINRRKLTFHQKVMILIELYPKNQRRLKRKYQKMLSSNQRISGVKSKPNLR